jgi:O-antigen/teichoic acid export membrane protein
MVTLTNIVNWAIVSIDNFFIGWFFDTVLLGLYNRVYTLLTTPINNTVAILQQVMFPLYSRAHHDLPTVRKAYLACVECLGTLLLPAYGCLAVVPSTVIQGLFGGDWAAATPLVMPLALAMFFHAMMAIGGPVLWAQDQVGREFRAELSTALVSLLVFVITSRFSVVVLTWGVLGVYILRFVLVTRMALKTLGISWSRFMNSMSGGLVLLIPTGTVVFFSDHAIAFMYSSASLRLVFDVAVGTGVLLGTILIAPKLVFSLELCRLANRMVDRLPIPIQPLMRKVFA